MANGKTRSRIEHLLGMQIPQHGVLPGAAWAVVLLAAMPVLYVSAAIHVAPASGATAVSIAQAGPSGTADWPEQVSSVITPGERDAYKRLGSDEERQHFIEQFWSRRFSDWVDEVAYIIRDEERAAYRHLQTEEERHAFIEQFWQRMDPTPGTAENEFKNEYYRRLAYANRTFGTATGSTWRTTDRGRIYIIYGQPDRTQSFPAGGRRIARGGQTKTYAFERWQYRRIAGIGNDVAFDFADATGSGDFRLVPPGTRPIDPAGPRANRVEDVWVTGNRRIPAGTIKSRLQTGAGAEESVAVIAADIESLYTGGQFDDVRVEETGGPSGGRVVVFVVREKQ